MMYADRQYRQSSQRVEAHVTFLDFLFRSLPLRKIYHEVYEFNLDATRILESGGFAEEGRFRQHVWYEDRYWDVIRFALYRDGWAEGRKRVRLLLDVGEDAAQLLAEQPGKVENRPEDGS